MKNKDKLLRFIELLRENSIELPPLESFGALSKSHKEWEYVEKRKKVWEILITLRAITDGIKNIDALIAAKAFLTDRIYKLQIEEKRRQNCWHGDISNGQDYLDFKRFLIAMEIYSNVLIMLNDFTKEDEEFQSDWIEFNRQSPDDVNAAWNKEDYLKTARQAFEVALASLMKGE